MVPSFWATEEQLIFLRSQLHEFLEKQKEKKLALFWPSLHCNWFSRWPASDPNIPLPVDKEQLDAYQQAEGATISWQKKVSAPVTQPYPSLNFISILRTGSITITLRRS
jgi:hypothetical protein